MSSANKKHEPTSQKLERARKDGQVAKSPVFTQIFQLVGVMIGAGASIHFFWSTNEILLHYKGFWDSQNLSEWMVFWSLRVGKSVLVTLGFGLIGTLMGEGVQVGARISLKPMRLDGKRLNPAQGVLKIGKDLKNIWLVLIKFLGASAIAFFVIALNVQDVPHWLLYPTPYLADRSLSMFSTFSLSVVGFWFVIGMLERSYKKFEFLKEQKMTDEELKREMKDSEGDPHIRSSRRALQRELAFTEMAQRVKKAKVIIVKRK